MRLVLGIVAFLCLGIVAESDINSIDSDGVEKLDKSKFRDKKLSLIKKKDKTTVKKLVSKKIDKVTQKPVTTTPQPLPPQVVTTSTPKIRAKPLNQNERDRLRSKLLNGYNKEIHPTKSHRDKVTVNVGMALIHLDLNEKKSILDVDAWMRMSWTDENLRWNHSEFQGLDQIHFGPDELWKPDIFLYNNADSESVHKYSGTQLLVFPDGKVLWVPPAKLRSFCKINLKMWPLDIQTCTMKFGSWTSHGDQIDIGLYEGSSNVELLNLYTNNKEWTIQSTAANISKTKYQCCEEKYPDITFRFTIQRKSPTYRATVVLPCLVTMLMVVSGFLLPPNAGEKLTINTVSFIICTLYLLYLSSTLPALSDQIPLIVLFYSNTTALIGIAVVLNVICLSLTRERKYRKPPKFLRNLFTGALGKFLCLGNYYHQVSHTHHRLQVEMEDVNESPECEQDTDLSEDEGLGTPSVMRDWFLVAAGIERFFFLVYSLAFAVVSSVYM